MTEDEAPLWVHFGKSRVELDVAAEVLRLMADREPEHLGAYIGEAMLGVEPRVRRRGRG